MVMLVVLLCDGEVNASLTNDELSCDSELSIVDDTLTNKKMVNPSLYEYTACLSTGPSINIPVQGNKENKDRFSISTEYIDLQPYHSHS